jgi:hypothetical protein
MSKLQALPASATHGSFSAAAACGPVFALRSEPLVDALGLVQKID